MGRRRNTNSMMRATVFACNQAAVRGQASLDRPKWFAFVNLPPFLMLVTRLGLLPYPLACWV